MLINNIIIQKLHRVILNGGVSINSTEKFDMIVIFDNDDGRIK